MSKLLKGDVFRSGTVWKVYAILACLCLFFFIMTTAGNKRREVILASSSSGAAKGRVEAMARRIENKLITENINILNDLEERLSIENSDRRNLMNTWLQTHPDIMSVTMWMRDQQDPLLIIQNSFWNDPQVLGLPAAERQTIFNYLFENQRPSPALDQPYFIGPLFSEQFLPYPILSFGIPLQVIPGSQALEMKIRLIDWKTLFSEPLFEGETLTLKDSENHVLFASEAPQDTRSASFTESRNTVTGESRFISFPWTLVYSGTQSASRSMNPLTAPALFLGIALLASFPLSLLLSVWIDRPYRRFRDTASAIARDNFEQELPDEKNESLNKVVQLFNLMARELNRMRKLDVGEIISEKNKTEAILRNIADAVIVTDTNEHILVVNDVCEKWFGLIEKEAIQTPIEQCIHNDALIELLHHVKNGKAHGSIDFQMISPVTGEEKVFQAHAARIHNQENALVGVVTVIRDVTREKEVDQSKTELVSMVAHELKSPLTSIYGFSELLLDSDLTPQKTKEYAQVILNESTRLTEMVNKFLDLSRLESGRTEVRMVPFDLRQVVEKILDTYGSQAEKKQVKVITDIPANLPLAMGDPDMIEQVILNLYSNAIKYSPECSKVGIEAKQDGQGIMVSVIDNGYGIPKESLPFIFDKFYRVIDTENEQEVEGSGLGLALAREIVERHGGKITVNSRLGVGSVFSFNLSVVE